MEVRKRRKEKRREGMSFAAMERERERERPEGGQEREVLKWENVGVARGLGDANAV